MDQLTIVICARNAASTIERALESAIGQGSCSILLVDDCSEDETTAVAERVGPSRRVRITRTPLHLTLGAARQFAVEQIDTPWLMWLDADDALGENRADRLLGAAFLEDADVVFDNATLFDGRSGEKVTDLPIPDFIATDPTASRQFERNFIPGLGWALVRTDLARTLGYDALSHGVEDFDFCLRAIASNARFRCVQEAGYIQYAYPTSVSRDIYQRRRDLVRLYKKHSYQGVSRLLGKAGWPDRVVSWVLIAMAIFREEYERAHQELETLDDTTGIPEILEPAGPYPVPESFRLAFYRGTLLLFLNRDGEALDALGEAVKRVRSPEALNNLGVVLNRLGRTVAAQKAFEEAHQRFPGYLDARLNLGMSGGGGKITPILLRMQPNRNAY